MRPFLLATVLALAAPATAQTLLVGNKGEDTVSFIDLKTGRELARTATGRMPHEIAVSPDGKRAAVVAYGGNSIDVFDVASAKSVERIDLGTNLRPHGLVWLPDGRLVATAEGSSTLVVVRMAGGAGERVRSFPTTQQGSHMVAINPRGPAYVANIPAGTVSVVDVQGNAPIRLIQTGPRPEGIALSPDGKRLWVADLEDHKVRVYDTETLKQLTVLPAGQTPIRIAITPDGRRAYASNVGAGTLSVYDAVALKPSRTITVSGDPKAAQVTILLSKDGKRLYAAETGVNQVAEVDLTTGKVLRRLPAGKNGDGLAISPLTARPAAG